MPARVIPCLLLRNGGLVKTTRFSRPTYLGDPINAVRIFNDKEVDELVFLDILATVEHREPPFDLLAKVASQCFMPLCYGGGVRHLAQMKQLFAIGLEKVAVNTHAVEDPDFVRQAADEFGSQSIIVSIDVRRTWRGRYEVVTESGSARTGLEPVRFAVTAQDHGAGEILLNSVDRDGTLEGYDIDLVRLVSKELDIPVVACGGAGKRDDLRDVIKDGGASAAAAGSLFVFQLPQRAVLINYPSAEELEALFARDAGPGVTR